MFEAPQHTFLVVVAQCWSFIYYTKHCNLRTADFHVGGSFVMMGGSSLSLQEVGPSVRGFYVLLLFYLLL